MPQVLAEDFPIDPVQTDGAELADLLNRLSEAVNTSNSGAAPPPDAEPGTLWLDTSTPPMTILKILAGDGTTWTGLDQVSEGIVIEAPEDGQQYARKDGAWNVVEGVTGDKGDKGDTGAQGPAGATGPQGSQGAAGTGIIFKGAVPTVPELPAGGSVGDAYLVESDDSLWIWDGTEWVNGGSIQGPPGPQGPEGQQGVQGQTGPAGTGAQGDPGPIGPQGLLGPAGAQGVKGDKGDKGDPGDAGPVGPPGLNGDVPEAPLDGKQYGRQAGAWTESAGGIAEAPLDGRLYSRKSASWVETGGLIEAPVDGLQYARKNGAWDAVATGNANWSVTSDAASALATLTAPSATATPGAAVLALDKHSTGAAAIEGRKATVLLWRLAMPSTSDDFRLERYSAGTLADTPIQIATNGSAVFTSLAFKFQCTPAFSPGGATMILQGTDDATNSDSLMQMRKGLAGRECAIEANLKGAKRWRITLGDTVAEAAPATGANFSISRYNNSGSLLGKVIEFARDTGLGTVIGDPTAALGIATKSYVDSKSGAAGAKSIQVLAGTGTYTSTAGTRAVLFVPVGGGGAGGGAGTIGTSGNSVGGGGASGAVAYHFLTSGFDGLAYSVGAGGVPGAPGAVAGGGGANTTIGAVTATGGSGGNFSGVSQGGNVSGGGGAPKATGANVLNGSGNYGLAGTCFTQLIGISGGGGNGPWGGGGGYNINNGDGLGATNFGAGGSGAINCGVGGPNRAGGAGFAGTILAYEY